MISKHFSIKEFIHSNTAKAHGIDNTMPTNFKYNAERTGIQLEIIREVLKRPCNLNSGFRSKELNYKLANINGYTPSNTSAHLSGRAADVSANKSEQELVKKYYLKNRNDIDFDQLIIYHERGQNFLHIGVANIDSTPRKMIGYAKKGGGYRWI